MHENGAKVISMVPSWTETLLSAGVRVVGRTRFCIHPDEMVKQIAVVGGTKNIKIEEILNVKPDYVILDKEENRLEMAKQLEQHGIQILVSHVTDIESAAAFLDMAAEKLQNEKLAEFARRYRVFLNGNKSAISRQKFWSEVCVHENSQMTWKNLSYVIWKNPFMCIGQGTFIQDVFKQVGVIFEYQDKYPEVNADQLKSKYCLFSSEPYPFGKEFASLTAEGFRGALVDGEKISWYGIRNLIFLERCRE